MAQGTVTWFEVDKGYGFVASDDGNDVYVHYSQIVSDGKRVLPLEPAQDHKAIFDGDTGPNTGGMGAYSDSRILSEAESNEIMERIIRPTVARTGFTGFLYAGLMMTVDGPRILEYNVRLGDPETQPIMVRLRSDFVALCQATLDGRLADFAADWDPRASLGVVMAAGGYPGAYRRNDTISGLPDAEDERCKVFHAGTAIDNDRIVTSGGRVLCVVGLGSNVSEARDRAYAGVDRIHWADAYYRKDIGYRAIGRDAH